MPEEAADEVRPDESRPATADRSRDVPEKIFGPHIDGSGINEETAHLLLRGIQVNLLIASPIIL